MHPCDDVMVVRGDHVIPADFALPDFLFLLVTEQMMEQSTVHSTEHSFYHWLGT